MTALEMLKKLEWSGTAHGPGGRMGDLGEAFPACPECRGIKDVPGVRDNFASGIGHKRNCELKRLLK